MLFIQLSLTVVPFLFLRLLNEEGGREGEQRARVRSCGDRRRRGSPVQLVSSTAWNLFLSFVTVLFCSHSFWRLL
jgi:hypothetical protein